MQSKDFSYDDVKRWVIRTIYVQIKLKKKNRVKWKWLSNMNNLNNLRSKELVWMQAWRLETKNKHESPKKWEYFPGARLTLLTSRKHTVELRQTQTRHAKPKQRKSSNERCSSAKQNLRRRKLITCNCNTRIVTEMKELPNQKACLRYMVQL